MKLWLLFLLSLLITLSFTPTTHSQQCTSQTFTNKNLYKNCTDLPTLDSFLHYTYDAENSTLSIVFSAPPAEPGGWIAWGINPKGTDMAGTQALLAYQKSNGKMTVKTYNLVSYVKVVQSNISFDVSEMEAEYSDGVMRIFAKFELPKNMTVINQVWQVGPSVISGFPVKHAFKRENLNAKAELKLDESAGKNNNSENGSSRIGDTRFGLYFVVLFSLFGILIL